MRLFQMSRICCAWLSVVFVLSLAGSTGCSRPPETTSSHAGELLAFTCSPSANLAAVSIATADSNSRLVVIDLATGQSRHIEIEGGVVVLAISPDGTQLAFSSMVALSPTKGVTSPLYIADLTVAGALQPRTVDKALCGFLDIAWAPNSDRIAYDYFAPSLSPSGTGGLRIRDIDDGSTVTFEKYHTVKVTNPWPQTDRLYARHLFARNAPDMLIQLNPVTGTSSEVANTDDCVRAAVAPDGSHIAIAALLMGQTPSEDRILLKIIDLSTGIETAAVDAAGAYSAWSPDSSQLAIVRDSADAAGSIIGVIDQSASAFRQIASWDKDEVVAGQSSFEWLSDDTILVVTKGASGLRLQEWSVPQAAMLREIPLQ